MPRIYSDNPSRAGSLHLIGDVVALDFANTSSGRGSSQHLDHLREPLHVVAWAHHVGVLGDAASVQAQALIEKNDPAFRDLLPRALMLREAIHGIGESVATGNTPRQADLRTVAIACASAIAAADLTPTDDGFRWTWPTDPPLPETILGPVALSAAGLLREGDLSRLKKCGGEHCGWLFFDLTKNNSRRWCDMAVCGNRQKSKRNRQRRTFAASEEP
ncbi:CGNR zinc finger domain-containing protein [Microvirga rosea]|uniref:CGNR zinc finger domain-containing protein n=1 Tax=Microvirga rosea TaxID=2715425 RepID=UPI001D0B80CF|nr:ABATE domain-containing protein [Microvirga rosea]MCB8823142.1 CGNR zinc finger domain-containing protein [Microvirga rosea]